MIGVYVDNLDVPWMEFIYRLAEKTDIVLFTNNYGKVDVHSNIAVLSSSYIWSFPYPVIAADMFSARYLYECPIPTRKLFYINHVDWSNGFMAVDTVKATSLELLCEPDLAPLVKSIWKEPKIVRNWHHETIRRILDTRTD